MNTKNFYARSLETRRIIEEVLGVDTAPLMTATVADAGRHDDVLYGLGHVLQRALQITLQNGMRRDVALHVLTGPQAEAQHWPDATTANLGMLLGYGWLLPFRRQRGLPFAPLTGSKGAAVDRPAYVDPKLRELSVNELVAKLETTAEDPEVGDGRDASATFPISIVERMKSSLRLDPATRSFAQKANALSSADDLERLACRYLEQLAAGVLGRFKTMHNRQATEILVRENVAQDLCDFDSRAERVATVLAAALHAVALKDISLVGVPAQQEDKAV